MWIRSRTITLYRSLREARPYWRLIALFFAIGLLATPISLLAPVPLKVVTDSVLGGDPAAGPLTACLLRVSS